MKNALNLPLTEWDFSTLFEYELEPCFFWEYLREAVVKNGNTLMLERIMSMRKRISSIDFDNCMKFLMTCGLKLDHTHLYYLSPEWPEKAYLSLPFAERKRRIELIPASPGESFREAGNDPVLPPCEIKAFRIDWRHTNGTILKRFEEWLIHNRPSGITITTTRGKNNAVSYFKRNLKALGAYRLTKTMTVNKARTYTSENNRTLYGKSCKWSGAKKLAKTIIHRFTLY